MIDSYTLDERIFIADIGIQQHIKLATHQQVDYPEINIISENSLFHTRLEKGEHFLESLSCLFFTMAIF